ncbi:hypothetical protein CROQUDRAFT_706659 [Cronartium quercuum f. sp. fusiforme G11]|uniref:Uncharacterized protein n=1 Tax=Cronartium quercuum f. sp. fusiforme G11 TaxID=708437 RepID=A0A9P6NJH8_9BASI|nr:hypothetical protein CROQUDRAFT_706659 [Cronartium quercuum f. sp. fusiforme G11]
MILSRMLQATNCYWGWNISFRNSINKLKEKHWRAFLAKSQDNFTFKKISVHLTTENRCSGTGRLAKQNIRKI